MKSRKKIILTIIHLTFTLSIFSQDILWTGNAGDWAFFNENNWRNLATNTTPTAGTIDPDVAINANLIIENVTGVVGGTTGISNDIKIGSGSLTIRKSTLKMVAGKGIDMGNVNNALKIDSAVVTADFLKNTTTTISGDSKLYLMALDPIDATTSINITSYDSWIFIPSMNAVVANTTIINRITIFGSAFQTSINANIIQYYDGTAINPFILNYKPLQIFDNENFTGTFADIEAKGIYSGTSMPNNLNNKLASFRLKKGYMAVFANEADGTGMSQVYIASESDLNVNLLPNRLKNDVSFIRVLPWSWVNKKGTGGDTKGVNASWFYNWGSALTSNLDRQYAPMTWGKSSIDTQDKVNALVRKINVTHIMSFNESDNCNDQSGQYGSLCIEDTAVIYHKNLMKTGLRILSPSCREGEELDWVKNLNTLAVPAAIRMDAIGMHWYDWGASPSTTPDEDPAKIFARFKAKVNACYNYYKMPIWITEFNANKFRNTWVQDEFLKLALPWLESTWFVERYAYFQPNGGNGNFFDANGAITSTGSIYLNQLSTPSIKEQDYNKLGNNLQKVIDIPSANEEIQSNKKCFELYPNPLNNKLIIAAEENLYFDLFNMQGNKVKSFAANETIALDDLPKGIYLVLSSGYTPQKLLIQ